MFWYWGFNNEIFGVMFLHTATRLKVDKKWRIWKMAKNRTYTYKNLRKTANVPQTKTKRWIKSESRVHMLPAFHSQGEWLAKTIETATQSLEATASIGVA